jgi:aspartyl-tRNA(Asn)/glutamyl-tRNA(Gln) amidotransferase subunit B
MEVHVELATPSKMFCGCPADHFQVKPNTHTCPVCLGLPGAMPVPNQAAIRDTIRLGLALGCQINLKSKFDRKHYFYPDLPKGYQISQYDEPLSYSGSLTLSSGRRVRITRVHLEEDTGKLQHKDGATLVDYNRSGVPLVEIVSEPDLTSAEEAKEYLKLIHSTVRYLGISDADMEKGSMRLEANISVAVNGVMPEYKVEVKNVNSFRYIAASIEYEIKRQTEILKDNRLPDQETRGWSLDRKGTVSQRKKETAHDYRYFPEPDIPRLEFSAEEVAKLKADLPLLPHQVLDQLAARGVRLEYAQTAVEDRSLAEYCLELAELAQEAKFDADKAVGLVINAKLDWRKLSPDKLLQQATSEAGAQKLDQTETQKLVDSVIEQHSKVVEDYKGGKVSAIQFLLGQVMASSRGQADPELSLKLLQESLD